MTPQNLFSLSDKVALVLGGSSGIGREIALGYHEAGARVLPASRRRHKVDAVVAEIRSGGGDAAGYEVDARDLDSLRALVSRVVSEHGRIDVLVNSQGTTILKPAEEFTEEEYDDVVDTDLKSLFFACLEVGRHMLERREGAIVNIASLASYTGWREAAPYAASKFGVVGLTQTLAAEWGARGVRVNALAPGWFVTDLNRERLAGARGREAVRRTPMGRFGELRELVGAAIFLASPAASFVTGEVLRVDGGYMSCGI